MTLSVKNITYNPTYKIIGKHPDDGRLFAVKYDNTNGLYVVDRNLNLIETLSTTLDNSDFYNYGQGINECLVLKSGTMICWGIYRTGENQTIVWRSTDDTYSTFEQVFSLPTNIGFIEKSVDYSTLDDTIMLCEYTMEGKDPDTNLWLEPHQLNIWRGSNDAKYWDVAFTMNRNPQFPGDTSNLRHFHTVRYDSFSNLFWIGSGDASVEDKIWTITPDGQTVNLIAEGTVGYASQELRTTSFMFTRDYVWWGSDSFLENQHPFSRYNRHTETIEHLTTPNDCIRLSDELMLPNNKNALIANKSYEFSPTNTNKTTELYVCDELVIGDWYPLFEWDVGNINDVAVFFQLVDNKDGRIYVHCRNILDDIGTSQRRITAIIDIEDSDNLANSNDFLYIYTENGIQRYPLYDDVGDGLKINFNGTKRIDVTGIGNIKLEVES